jgi:hypothetical protein
MLRRRSLVAIVVVVGFFVGFGSGLVEVEPDFADIPENKYYGFPLAWRVVNTATGEKFTYPLELFVDCLFGILMVGIVAVATAVTEKWMKKNAQTSK